MKKPQSETSPRRIAVILGTGGSGRSLLEHLWPLLGRKLSIEVIGIFVEDDELQRAANLPFVKELCRLTFSLREFQNVEFERAVAMRMRAARSALDELAGRAGISHSFRNVRGSALKTLLETALESDITVFQPLSLFASTPPHTGTRVRPSPRHLMVGLDDLDSGNKALIAAGVLARGLSCRVTVVAAGAAAGDPETLSRLVEYSIHFPGVRVRTVTVSDNQALIQAARLAGPDMLVLGASESLLDTGALRTLREQLRCPVFLVRQWHDNQGEKEGRQDTSGIVQVQKG